MKKSKRLLPVKNLKRQKERVEAKKLAQAQQKLNEAIQRKEELENYLSEYYVTMDSGQKLVKSASQLGGYQAFIARLKQAIANQNEFVKQHEILVKGQRENWIKANEKRIVMEGLIEKSKIQEALEEGKKEQKVLDDRPYSGRSGFE